MNNHTKTIKATPNKITRIYEVKLNRKWSKVRATSMAALSKWATENNISDWKMVGMMSRTELAESQNLEVVA